MAQFSYAQYMAQRAQQRPASTNNGERTPVHFVNEFMSADGSEIVVRFPYHSMEDVTFIPTHNVDWIGSKYGKRVACSADGNCPFCAEGKKMDYRVIVKCLVYTVDMTTNKVVINDCLWDRPAAFADIDLKNLFTEYGDISQYLFKIRRNGTGTSTRYTLSIIVNNAIYNPEVYAPDFSTLEQLEGDRICVKTYQQYLDMINGINSNAQTQAAPAAVPSYPAAPVNYPAAVPQVSVAPQTPIYAEQAPVYAEQIPTAAPAAQSYVQQAAPQTYTTQVPQAQPVQQVAPQTYATETPNAYAPMDPAARQPKKYTF